MFSKLRSGVGANPIKPQPAANSYANMTANLNPQQQRATNFYFGDTPVYNWGKRYQQQGFYGAPDASHNHINWLNQQATMDPYQFRHYGPTRIGVEVADYLSDPAALAKPATWAGKKGYGAARSVGRRIGSVASRTGYQPGPAVRAAGQVAGRVNQAARGAGAAAKASRLAQFGRGAGKAMGGMSKVAPISNVVLSTLGSGIDAYNRGAEMGEQGFFNRLGKGFHQRSNDIIEQMSDYGRVSPAAAGAGALHGFDIPMMFYTAPRAVNRIGQQFADAASQNREMNYGLDDAVYAANRFQNPDARYTRVTVDDPRQGAFDRLVRGRQKVMRWRDDNGNVQDMGFVPPSRQSDTG